MNRPTAHSKVRPEHLRRQAVVYIRQSSAHQVRVNRESSSRQYALVERAKAIGWPAKSVEIIDIHKLREDMGEKTVAIDAFEGNNLVLVDEGHRGSSGIH